MTKFIVASAIIICADALVMFNAKKNKLASALYVIMVLFVLLLAGVLTRQ